MGYRRKIYDLRWPEGHDLHGLEVSLTGLSVERIAKLTRLAGLLTGGTNDTDEMLAAADEIFQVMAKCLVEWNMEDHQGNPVPASLEGLKDQDVMLVAEVAQAWMGAAASVDNPLPNGSKPSPSSALEASIPMTAASSPNPGN